MSLLSPTYAAILQITMQNKSLRFCTFISLCFLSRGCYTENWYYSLCCEIRKFL